jgi:hypothetical protein
LEELFEYALQHVADTDKVGMTIRNEENQNDRPIGFSWRFKDQIAVDVIKSLFEKVVQSNARFNAIDKLVIEVHSVKMPVVFGRLKTNGRPFKELIRGKRSVVEVNAEENCLAHAIVLATAKLNNHPNYESFRKGCLILPHVRRLLTNTGIDLIRGGGLPELAMFQQYLTDYRIVVYEGFDSKRIMFDGQNAGSTKPRINLLNDDITRHYHVINNLTGATIQEYVCRACNKGC